MALLLACCWCAYIFVALLFLTACVASPALASHHLVVAQSAQINVLWKWHTALGYVFFLCAIFCSSHNSILTKLRSKDKDVKSGIRKTNACEPVCGYILDFLVCLIPLVTAIGLLCTSFWIYFNSLNQESLNGMYYSSILGLVVTIPAVIVFPGMLLYNCAAGLHNLLVVASTPHHYTSLGISHTHSSESEHGGY